MAIALSLSKALPIKGLSAEYHFLRFNAQKGKDAKYRILDTDLYFELVSFNDVSFLCEKF